MGRGKVRSSRALPKPINGSGRKMIGFGLWLMGFAKSSTHPTILNLAPMGPPLQIRRLGRLLLISIDGLRIKSSFAIAKIQCNRVAGSWAGGRCNLHHPIKARAPSGMTCTRTGLLNFDPDCILVTVDAHLNDALTMA